MPRQKTETILTTMEFKVLQLIVIGFNDQRIADIMVKSKRTIETHRQNMVKKLKANNTPHAVALAYKKGILNA